LNNNQFISYIAGSITQSDEYKLKDGCVNGYKGIRQAIKVSFRWP